MSENNKKDKSSEATQNGEPMASNQIVVHAQYVRIFPSNPDSRNPDGTHRTSPMSR